MKESQIKLQMVREIQGEGGYGRRIEDRFSVGMPDLVLIPMTGPVVWVEVKIVRGNILAPTPRQSIELRRLHRPPHSTSYLVGWKEGVLYIVPPPGAEGVDIKDCMKMNRDETVGELIRRAMKKEENDERRPQPSETSTK